MRLQSFVVGLFLSVPVEAIHTGEHIQRLRKETPQATLLRENATDALSFGKSSDATVEKTLGETTNATGESQYTTSATLETTSEKAPDKTQKGEKDAGDPLLSEDDEPKYVPVPVLSDGTMKMSALEPWKRKNSLFKEEPMPNDAMAMDEKTSTTVIQDETTNTSASAGDRNSTVTSLVDSNSSAEETKGVAVVNFGCRAHLQTMCRQYGMFSSVINAQAAKQSQTRIRYCEDFLKKCKNPENAGTGYLPQPSMCETRGNKATYEAAYNEIWWLCFPEKWPNMISSLEKMDVRTMAAKRREADRLREEAILKAQKEKEAKKEPERKEEKEAERKGREEKAL